MWLIPGVSRLATLGGLVVDRGQCRPLGGHHGLRLEKQLFNSSYCLRERRTLHDYYCLSGFSRLTLTKIMCGD